jgi:hypothetical protein
MCSSQFPANFETRYGKYKKWDHEVVPELSPTMDFPFLSLAFAQGLIVNESSLTRLIYISQLQAILNLVSHKLRDMLH